MKKTIFLPVALIVAAIAAKSQSFDEWELLSVKESAPLTDFDGEVLKLGNVCLERIYGENEFVFTPLLKNDREWDEFQAMRKNNLYDNEPPFVFVKVINTQETRQLLELAKIYVPEEFPKSYILAMVHVGHLKDLKKEGLQIEEISYGKKILSPYKLESESTDKQAMATIFTEGFEINAVPGSNYSIQIDGSNCGWADMQCFAHTGTWSVYCAGDGSSCYSNCNKYPNNMDSYFWKTQNLTFSPQNLVFEFWIDFDLGANDYVYRYYNIGNGWQLSATYYNGNHSWNLAGYKKASFNYTGNYSVFNFKFNMESNMWSDNEIGANIDDIALYGSGPSLVEKYAGKEGVLIWPNPAKDFLSVSAETVIRRLEIMDVSGKTIVVENPNTSQMQLDLQTLNPGVYFVKTTLQNGKCHTAKMVKD